jgi:L-2-hydroxyglutarate oxidase LhgO
MNGSTNQRITSSSFSNETDVVLLDAGVMSATRTVPLKELDPNLRVEVREVLAARCRW